MSSEGDRIHGEVVTLRDYFERVIRDLENKINTSERSGREAVTKAEAALDKRVDLLNKFRAQSAEESKRYAPIDRLDAIDKELTKVRTDHVPRNDFERVRTSANRSQAVAGISVLLFAGTLSYTVTANDRTGITHDVAVLQQQQALLRSEIATIQQLDKFFCHTRTPTLPAC